MNKRILYAAYGSNMNIEQMKQRCPKAEIVGVGSLEDYKLGFRHSGVATIISFANQSVPIVLWSITVDCEQRLDVYEGFPRLYIKQTVSVAINGMEAEAMAYIMNSCYSKNICLPSKAYYRTIETGYIDNNISTLELKETLLEMVAEIYGIQI